MTTLAKRGAGTPVTTNTTWTTVANAVDGVPPANPATYAVWTSTQSGGVATIEITGYDFSTVADTYTLNSVTVSIRNLVNNTGRYSKVEYQAWSGGVALGTIRTGTLTTSAHNDSGTFACTLAQLKAADFKVRVTITRAAVTQSATFSLDYADVTADYTAPPPNFGTSSVANTWATSAAGVKPIIPLHNLVDGFDTGISSTVWPRQPNVLYDTTYKRAAFRADSASLGTGYGTTRGYTLIGSSLTAKITPPVDRSAVQIFQGIRYDSANYVQMVYSGGNLRASMFVNPTTTYVGGIVAYNPAVHVWWRIRESGGQVYFETSPDSLVWTNPFGATLATPAWLDNVEPSFTMQAGLNTDYGYIDNINLGTISFQNLQTWLDANDASTFSYKGGFPTSVYQWNDKSGSGKNFSGPGIGHAYRTGSINGLTTVVVANENDSCSIQPPVMTATNDFVMFIVCRRTGGNATNSIPLANGALSFDGYGIAARAGTNRYGFLRGAIAWHESTKVEDGGVHLHSLMKYGVNQSIEHRIDGISTSLNGLVSMTVNTPTDRTFIPANSAGHAFAGDICEVLIYDRRLAWTEFANIESYLKTKWIPPKTGSAAVSWNSSVAAVGAVPPSKGAATVSHSWGTIAFGPVAEELAVDLQPNGDLETQHVIYPSSVVSSTNWTAVGAADLPSALDASQASYAALTTYPGFMKFNMANFTIPAGEQFWGGRISREQRCVRVDDTLSNDSDIWIGGKNLLGTSGSITQTTFTSLSNGFGNNSGGAVGASWYPLSQAEADAITLEYNVNRTVVSTDDSAEVNFNNTRITAITSPAPKYWGNTLSSTTLVYTSFTAPGGAAALTPSIPVGQATSEATARWQGYALTDVPSNFVYAKTVTITFRAWFVATSLGQFFVKIHKLDGTVLAGGSATTGQSLGAIPLSAAEPVADTVVSFDYINDSATKADWDNAIISIGAGHTHSAAAQGSFGYLKIGLVYSTVVKQTLHYDFSDAASRTMSGVSCTAIAPQNGLGPTLGSDGVLYEIVTTSPSGRESIVGHDGARGFTAALTENFTSDVFTVMAVARFVLREYSRLISLGNIGTPDWQDLNGLLVVSKEYGVFPAVFKATPSGPMVATATTTFESTWVVLTALYSGTTVTFRVNGTEYGTPALITGPMNASRLGIGGQCSGVETGDAWWGEIGEIRMWNGLLSAPGVAQFENELNTKWIVAIETPNEGTATTAWNAATTSIGKRYPKSTTATAWADAITAVGRRAPRAVATTAWVEAVIAAGQRTPKAVATTAWAETLVVVGKRTPKSSITTTHTWVTSAVGAKPVVGMKQGAATVSWAENLVAVGKRAPKAVATTLWNVTLTAAGKKTMKATTAVAWATALTAVGRRAPKGSSTTAFSWAQSATGKRTPKAATTIAHTWDVTAVGAAPVVGQKQGSATVAWDVPVGAVGRRIPKGGQAITYVFATLAAGKKAQRGSTSLTTNWALPAGTGRRTPKASSITAWNDALTAAGKRSPRATSVTTHRWITAAQGVSPLVGTKQGNAVLVTLWTATAVGKRTPRATGIVVTNWATTAVGKKVTKGSAAVTNPWVLVAVGRKVTRGTAVTTYVFVTLASGGSLPKGRADPTYLFEMSASGVAGLTGLFQGLWNDQPVVEMQYDGRPVIDWMLVPS